MILRSNTPFPFLSAARSVKLLSYLTHPLRRRPRSPWGDGTSVLPRASHRFPSVHSTIRYISLVALRSPPRFAPKASFIFFWSSDWAAKKPTYHILERLCLEGGLGSWWQHAAARYRVVSHERQNSPTRHGRVKSIPYVYVYMECKMTRHG